MTKHKTSKSRLQTEIIFALFACAVIYSVTVFLHVKQLDIPVVAISFCVGGLFDRVAWKITK